jgi:hypothetical protein
LSYIYEHGTGTQEDPYQIWTADDLNGVRYHLSSHFIQMADIMEVGNFVPIANYFYDWAAIFTGSYNGNNFIIEGANIFSEDEYVVWSGLFGYAENATFINIILENIHHLLPGFNIGALIGGAKNCNITYCRINNGHIQGWDSVGGITGRAQGTTKISYCLSNTLVDIYLEGLPSWGGDFGGIVGQASPAVIIEKSFNSGNVNGNHQNNGGVIGGNNGGNIINCYSIGDITGNELVGGIAGYSYGNIINCYSIGYIEDTGSWGDHGGIVGLNEGEVINSYYNVETSGMSDTGKGIPLTTEEMKQQINYEDWDFLEIWGISEELNDGYPVLRAMYPDFEFGGVGELYFNITLYKNWIYIYTPIELYNIRYNLTGNFKLMANINISQYVNWLPIGNNNNYPHSTFRGVLDGNGFLISNLKIASAVDGSYQGLFGITNMAEIKRIGILNVDIEGINIGSIVGKCDQSIIEECFAAGNIKGTGTCGGLISIATDSDILNSYSRCSLDGNVAGGLIGQVITSDIENCYSSELVIGETAGGLIGINNSSIINSYYDTEKSEQNDTGKGIPLSTANMKIRASYLNWDFNDIWDIDD